MFEKEAEEYADKNKTRGGSSSFGDVTNYHDLRQGFKDGAEFGYNKANEWHYPSKGELPECDEKTQLIFYVKCYYEINGETIIRKRTVLGYYQNSFLNDDIKLFVEKSKGYEDEHLPKDVIVWKEIVPPSEPMRSLDKEEQKNYTEAINKVYKPTGVKLFDKESE